jgi:hypothetical protein
MPIDIWKNYKMPEWRWFRPYHILILLTGFCVSSLSAPPAENRAFTLTYDGIEATSTYLKQLLFVFAQTSE